MSPYIKRNNLPIVGKEVMKENLCKVFLHRCEPIGLKAYDCEFTSNLAYSRIGSL
ncbi:MAG TPA: hypothetical protein IAB72_04420 [Candidatus Onthoplasma faecipullorum]|nr:hypothetical protein [Candidatus Onthoplasma faecipullorum]